MKIVALACGVMVLGVSMKVMANEPSSQPGSRPAEKFFTTDGVGYELLDEKVPVRITAEQAGKLFSKDAGSKLAPDWEKQLPADADRRATSARTMPEDPKFLNIMRKPDNTDPAATVARFSKDQLVIRISRPAGNYLWHHYYDNVATLEVERSPALDDWFDLKALTAAYATPYKGVVQGDTQDRMTELLGVPDEIRHTQSMDFSIAVYEKGAVEIPLLNGLVQQVRRIPSGEKPAR